MKQHGVRGPKGEQINDGRALENIPDDKRLVLEDSDHHYREVGVRPGRAEQTVDHRLVVYYGTEHLEDGSEVVEVAVVI